jgi:hypothetical protein
MKITRLHALKLIAFYLDTKYNAAPNNDLIKMIDNLYAIKITIEN